MCRWQVEDKDVEDIHGAIVDHRPFFINKPFTKALSAAFTSFAQASATESQGGPSNL